MRAVASRSAASRQRFVERVPGAQTCDDPQAVVDAADLVFLTTPDDALADLTASLHWRSGQTVAHCSGVLTVNVLAPARRAGALVAGFHPLQSFPTLEHGLARLRGCTIALEGDEAALAVLEPMAHAIGGVTIRLQSEHKVLYHIAAVFASNYLVALSSIAVDLWSEWGADRQGALQALSPLQQGTLENIAALGILEALTGPIARGDVGTVRLHLQALATTVPHLLPAYRALGLVTLPIAEAKGGLGEEQRGQMLALLAGAGQAGLES